MNATLTLPPPAVLAPVFACDSRRAALEALRRIGRADGYAVDEYRAGAYTVFVPGRLALLYDDPSRNAWLCRVSAQGRLVGVEAAATWGDGR